MGTTSHDPSRDFELATSFFICFAPAVFVLEIQSNKGDDSDTSSTPAADNTNGWRVSRQTPVFCTSSPISFPSRIRASSFALNPSHIKIAPNHTAGKSFSADALDWIAVALSIGRNTFFTSQTKNTTTITNRLLDILCQEDETASNIEANKCISLTDAIIHAHKLAAGKFL